MKKLILSIFGLFVCAGLVSASGYYRGNYYSGNYYNNYYVKEVVREVAVPVIVPAYTFQYQPPCAVPVMPAAASATPVHNVAASPVIPQSSDNQDDRMRALAKALIEEMQRQAETENGPPVAIDPSTQNLQPQNPNPVSNPGLPPGINPRPNQKINAPQASKMTREQAAPIAMGALNRNCAACHTGRGAEGETQIFLQPNLFNPDVSWRSIRNQVERRRMPPTHSQFRLNNEEYDAVLAWLDGM